MKYKAQYVTDRDATPFYPHSHANVIVYKDDGDTVAEALDKVNNMLHDGDAITITEENISVNYDEDLQINEGNKLSLNYETENLTFESFSRVKPEDLVIKKEER